MEENSVVRDQPRPDDQQTLIGVLGRQRGKSVWSLAEDKSDRTCCCLGMRF